MSDWRVEAERLFIDCCGEEKMPTEKDIEEALSAAHEKGLRELREWVNGETWDDGRTVLRLNGEIDRRLGGDS